MIKKHNLWTLVYNDNLTDLCHRKFSKIYHLQLKFSTLQLISTFFSKHHTNKNLLIIFWDVEWTQCPSSLWPSKNRKGAVEILGFLGTLVLGSWIRFLNVIREESDSTFKVLGLIVVSKQVIEAQMFAQRFTMIWYHL